jgi:DNA invertase Pin-like site-specific DNA recombinase
MKHTQRPQTSGQQQAYSYVRFSSSDQAKGDSLRRQTELAEKYAKEHGLYLDTGLTFRDLGTSAFSGSNRTEGALSAFIKACKSGRVPTGSALLVESLDRLSREQVRKALRLLLELIDDCGIEVHTLGDRRVYGGGTDMADIMYSLMVMARANEESERKSQRVGAAWRQKKAAAIERPGTAITAKVPAWIHGEKGKALKLIPERAKIVKEIFSLALSGLGSQLIAQHLNAHYAPFSTNGKGWHKSYCEKILRHPATYGAYVPHRRLSKNTRKIDGEPILGFFPPVVDYATFQAVQTARASRYRQRRGSTSKTINNLFAGLVTDADYNLPMVYYWKGGELVTDSYRMKLQPHRIKYAEFESAFLTFLDQLDWTSVLDVTESEDLRQSEESIASLKFSLSRSEEQARRLVDLLIDTPSRLLKDRLLEAESEIQDKTAALALAQNQLEELRLKRRDLLSHEIVYTKLAEPRDLKARARLREEVRRKVASVKVTFKPFFRGDIGEHQIVAFVTFVNGAQRLVIFEGKEEGTRTILAVLTPQWDEQGDVVNAPVLM